MPSNPRDNVNRDGGQHQSDGRVASVVQASVAKIEILVGLIESHKKRCPEVSREVVSSEGATIRRCENQIVSPRLSLTKPLLSKFKKTLSQFFVHCNRPDARLGFGDLERNNPLDLLHRSADVNLPKFHVAMAPAKSSTGVLDPPLDCLLNLGKH